MSLNTGFRGFNFIESDSNIGKVIHVYANAGRPVSDNNVGSLPIEKSVTYEGISWDVSFLHTYRVTTYC